MEVSTFFSRRRRGKGHVSGSLVLVARAFLQDPKVLLGLNPTEQNSVAGDIFRLCWSHARHRSVRPRCVAQTAIEEKFTKSRISAAYIYDALPTLDAEPALKIAYTNAGTIVIDRGTITQVSA